jgi:hypothetical protein
MNASCPTGTGVATTPEPEPEPEPLPAPRCPAGATAAPGARYCSDLVGACLGPGGSSVIINGSDWVNGKVKSGVSRSACQAGCDAAPACVGYDYYASYERCYVYGPGLDTDLAGGWFAFTNPTTTIASADGNSIYVDYRETICVAVAGRN